MSAGTDRWPEIEQILDQVLAGDPRRWPALLDELCSGDAELRAEVESLLVRAAQAREFLQSPPAMSAAAFVAENEEPATGREQYEGRRIGSYRIVRELGRGGMSRVFLAERVDGGYTHHVALKLLRPGLDSEVDQARFRDERQILASLNHANIARLLDGGSTPEGLPYLALEYVDASPIDVYADERGLGVRERVAMFRIVCQTTQYAHRNLIVHRDLKPSNIFVDRDGSVKLLDFGLAKLVEPESARRGHSRTARRWMTPEYAAPEQIRGDPVTTLTDVYQLGAVLYELLTGLPPFSGRDESLHSLEEAVLHEEPVPPSLTAARNGRTQAANEMRGDLDAIILKALRKEPEQRYDSVAALDRDLGAVLSGYPVRARRLTGWYRAQRFARRRRVESIAALIVLATVISGVGFSLSWARRAEAERDRAAMASRESQAVSNFLLRLFEASDPAETRGDTLTADVLVMRAAARAERMHGEPVAQARMFEVTAQLYRSLGRFREELDALQRAVTLRQHAPSVDSLELARSLRLLSRSLVSATRTADADSVLRHAVAMQERLLGRDDPAVATTLLQMANVEVALGSLPRAAAHARRALAINERALGLADTSVGTSRLVLGSVLRRQGRFGEAEREYRAAWDVFARALGDDHPSVAESMLHVAYLLNDHPGRNAEAEPLVRRAIDIRRRALGEGNPMVAYAISDLARVVERRGDPDSALSLSRQALEIARRAYGPAHPTVALMTQQLAEQQYRTRRLVEAERTYRDAIELTERNFGRESERVSGAQAGLGMVLFDRQEFRAAEAAMRIALRLRARAYGIEHPLTADVEARVGMMLIRTGDHTAADSLLQHARRVMESHTSPAHGDLRRLYGWLADLETARGRVDSAARYRALAAAR